MHCQGVYVWSDGEKYVGEMRNNKSNGNGTHYYANGDKYVGEFKDDYKHRYGVQYYVNGDRYEGRWVVDKKDGIGVFHKKSTNQVFSENWNDNVQQSFLLKSSN